MGDITKKDVEHISKLARLNLTKEEESTMAKDMGSILSYVEKLSELNTDGVEPTAHVTGLENRFREDEVSHKGGKFTEKLIDQFPESNDGYNKVKGILKK